ncbi:hypothetical protein D3C76_830100 [compost metagenome]
MAEGLKYGWDGENRVPLNQIAQPVDLQFISLGNDTASIPVRLVDAAGNPITIGGGSSELPAVEMTTLVNSDQLRVNTAKTIALPSLLAYKSYVISVYNGTDQDIKVVPWNSAPVALEDGTIGYFATAATADNSYSWTIPKLTTGITSAFMLNTMEPKSNGAGTAKVKDPAKLFESMYNIDGAYMLAYRAPTAPTTGSVTIRVFGKRR